MEMNRQIRVLIDFSPRKVVPVPFEQQAGWVTETVWKFLEKRNISCLCRKPHLRTPGLLL